jgi:indolepyruvate ferredoxin oxidoreductase beta subunit
MQQNMPSKSFYKKRLDIVIVGVGGQGLITFGEVLGRACVKRGINIRIAETHGMSQRGGSVEVFVKLGEGVAAPLIPPGYADIVVATELIEALRGVKYLRKCGWLILSDVYIPPPTMKNALKPGEIIEVLNKLPINIIQVNAEEIARELKDFRVVNIAMLGGLIAFIEHIIPLDIIEEVVEYRLGEVNKKALRIGYERTKEKIMLTKFTKSDNCSES